MRNTSSGCRPARIAAASLASESKRESQRLSGSACKRMLAWMFAWTFAWALATPFAQATSAKPSSSPVKPSGTQVHRCIQPDGQTRYAQQACEASDASAVTLRFSDARTAAQVRQGQDVQERNAKLGRHLERGRRHMERQGAETRAMALTGSSEAKRKKAVAAAQAASKPPSGSHAKKKEAAKTDPRAPKPLRRADFTARVPGSGKSRKQAGEN